MMRTHLTDIVFVSCAGVLGSPSLYVSDVGPPVKIRMPREAVQPAVAGQVFAGTVEVLVGKAGVLDNFAVAGDCWTLVSIDTVGPLPVDVVNVVTVQFNAIPRDPTKLLYFSVTFNGRPARTLPAPI